MTSYHLDYAAFGRLVLNSEFMVAEMRRRADAAAEFARGIAPERTGHYKESISSDARSHGGEHHDRAEGVVTSSDNAALEIEYGHAAPDGSHVNGHYTLTQTLDVLGS